MTRRTSRSACRPRPALCFGFTADFEEYPSWAKDVKQVSVLARDEQRPRHRVEYHASALGKHIRYVLDYDFERGARRRSPGRWSRATCCARSTAATRSRPTTAMAA